MTHRCSDWNRRDDTDSGCLPPGQALVAWRCCASGNLLASAELYSPSIGKWEHPSEPMGHASERRGLTDN
jgi:hypothetical protein